MKKFIDRHYKTIRRFRFVYGWAVDRAVKMRSSARTAEWQAKGFRGAKLDVCGGRNPYKPQDYLNVDIVDFPAVDLVFDIRKRFPIDDNVIAEVLSVATLEHLRKPDVDHILSEFFRILQPGGMVRLSTPNIEAIARAIIDKTQDLATINQHLFGKFKSDDTEDYDVHRWMYTVPALIEKLHELGFERGEEIPLDIGLHDPVLNFLVRAYKPHS